MTEQSLWMHKCMNVQMCECVWMHECMNGWTLNVWMHRRKNEFKLTCK